MPREIDPNVSVTLSFCDAQALYDHMGTMPSAEGSWPNNVRDKLHEGLHEALHGAPAATDPRKIGGAIAGSGGPFDEDAVVFDTRRAVILEATEAAILGGIRKGVLDPKPIIGLVLRGRINKTDERVQALSFLNEDGAAALVTELVDVAARAGWGREFVDRVVTRLEALPEGPRA